MVARFISAALAVAILSSSALAQHGGAAPSSPNSVPADARQFAFLVGEHELTVKPVINSLAAKIHGVPKLVGTWRGWRAMDGFGVDDELRITDEAGNPKTLSHATRYYDASQKRWQVTAIDVYRGISSTSNGEYRENGVVLMSHGSDSRGQNYVLRTRFSDITPTSFRFRQERSYDEGKTWAEDLTIDAKRVASAASR